MLKDLGKSSCYDGLAIELARLNVENEANISINLSVNCTQHILQIGKFDLFATFEKPCRCFKISSQGGHVRLLAKANAFATSTKPQSKLFVNIHDKGI